MDEEEKAQATKFVARETGIDTDPNFYPDLVDTSGTPVGFTPINIPKFEEQEKPTIHETIGANFRQFNVPYRAIRALTQLQNPFNARSLREEDYDPIAEGLLDNVPEDYWSNVLSYNTRAEAMQAIENIGIELEDKDTMARSGTLTNVTSMLGATLLDPTTLIPISQTIKYATVSKGVFANMINASKTLVPAIAMQNAVLVGTKETEDIQDWAYATMLESFVACSVGGLLGGFAAKGAKSELKNAKAVFGAIKDDVDIKYLLGENGEVIKPIAKAMEGSTVGAQQVEGVQALLDSGQISFKDNKFVKTAFGWGSPMIKGLTNRFETTKKLTNQLFRNPFEVAGGVAKAINEPAAYDWVQVWRGTHAQAEIFTKAMWLDYLGVKGVGKEARAQVGALTNKYTSYEEFRNMVGQAYRRGTSDIPQIKQIVDLQNKEIYQPLFKEMQQRYPAMENQTFTNIVQFLNRQYHKGKIQERPDEFIGDVVNYLASNNVKLETLHAPINTASKAVNDTRAAIKSLKNKVVKPGVGRQAVIQEKLADINGQISEASLKMDRLFPEEGVQKAEYKSKVLEPLLAEQSKLDDSLNSLQLGSDQRKIMRDDLLNLENNLSEQKKLLNELTEKLNQDIADGKIDIDLLDGKVQLSAAEIEEVNQINAPVIAAEKELNAAKIESTKLGTISNFEKLKRQGKPTLDLENIVNQTANDFKDLGQKQALINLKRHRNGLIKQRKKLREDLNAGKEEVIPHVEHRATEQNIAESEHLFAIKEQIEPKQIEIEKQKQAVTKIEDEISLIEKKIGKLKDPEKIRKLKDEKLFQADLRKTIAKGKLSDLRDELKSLQAQVKTPTPTVEVKAGEESLLSERKVIENQLVEVNAQLKASKTTYEGLKRLLSHRDITIKDFHDLIKASRKSAQKVSSEVQAGVKASELELLRESKRMADQRVLDAKAKLKAANDRILNDIDAGLISENLYTRTARGAKIIDPNANPSLRPRLSKEDMQSIASGVRDNIMQLNEEQVLGEMFNNITAGGNNPFKSRVLMWNDSLAEKWLVNDMNQLSGMYVDQISKRLYLDDVLRQYGSDSKEGTKGIVKSLLDERNIMEAEILKKPDTPERVKELNKLAKDFKDTEKFVNDMYKIYMGNYVDNTTTAYRVTDGIKKFAAATMLGNLPILQLTEFVSPFFRFMFDEYVSDGLGSALKRMSYVAGKSGDVPYVRGAFADLNQGINAATGARTQALVGYGSQYQPKTLLERGVNNLANLSQNISAANHIMDFQETAVSFAAESSMLRSLKKYVNGEQLNKFEIDRLDRARLNPAEWGKRILDQRGVHATEEGAMISNFHLWTDQEAARRFRIAIERGVREVIIKPGALDVPFALKDPVLSLFAQFTSYMFAATNSFTVPLVTAPNSQMLLGMVTMMAAGAMVDPLRQLAKGEEIDYSPQALAAAAMNNSGIMGWQYSELMKANAMLDLPPLRFLQPDRFKRKTSGSLGGAATGILDSAFNIFSAVANNEMNERDAKRAMRLLVPFSGTWYAHKPMDWILKSFNLPKSREVAKRNKENE